ncbi:C2h2 conidiation transcription factor [Mycena venus]|uniref:C2h2 conidiation transcription factor n=1 Tax=Mycena venus TaxID=2733690 RepID=A0A8H6X2A2_9AGAR|nr:C2h2 conidiation transcription factor [Mycena venus]
MASTSTSTSYPSASVSLPSIHEMFPEHLMPRARPARPPASMFPRSHFGSPAPPPVSHLSFSFDVLKSDPRGSSLQHIASSRPSPAQHRRQALPAVRTQPPPSTRAHSLSGSSDGDAEMDVDGEDGEEGEDSAGAEEGKKHVCPTCAKRFNRPSSLRIHVNTHTGATPFRCPHPSCGRAFNVNSNMRRHFRNHASPSLASSASNSSNTSSPISPASSFNSPTSPSSYASSPPSTSWSPASTSSASRFSPKTPLSPLSLPHAWAPAPPKGMHGYSESDVRSERR